MSNTVNKAFYAFIVSTTLMMPFAAQAQTATPPAATPATAQTAPQSGPAQFIDQLGHTALMSLTAKDIPRSDREARVREVLEKNFDIPAIAKFALGQYWNSANEAQRKEYMSLFEDMIVQTYTTRFENYAGQQLKVGTAAASGDKDSVVNSQILQNGGPPINLQWRVRNDGGAMHVVDVMVDGISMSVTQRSDFNATIQSGGGNVDALLASMRNHQKQAK